MHATAPLYLLIAVLVGSAVGVVALLAGSPRARRFLDLSPWYFTEGASRPDEPRLTAPGDDDDDPDEHRFPAPAGAQTDPRPPRGDQSA